MTDTELWQAWREQGDAEAFTALAERYLDMVYATARRILGNTHDAEDVAQDCFIALLKGRVKVKHPIGPWLHRVARNRALDRIKGETRRRERERIWHKSEPFEAEPITDDIFQHVDEAIDALPKELRAAIVGRFLEGQTNHALGQRAGVAESTIRLRVSRGVEEIRATLAKRGVITTAAALGVLLEENMADAAPAGLRANIAKLTLATPPSRKAPFITKPVPLTLLAAGLLTVAGLLIGGVLLAERTPAPVVTVTTAPNESTTEAGETLLPAVEVRAASAPEGAAVTLAADTEEATNPSAALNAEPEEPTSTVSGTIYDDRGYPLPGATVTVVCRGGHYSLERLRIFRTTTTSDGTFRIGGIRHHKTFWGFTTSYHADREPIHKGLHQLDPPTLSHYLEIGVSAAGYATAGEPSLYVEPGTNKSGVDFTLAPGTTVLGRVVWPDGSPVANAGIVNVGVRSLDLRFLGSATDLASTDQDGYFVLGLEKPGIASLLAVSGDGTATLFPEVPVVAGDSPILTMTESAGLQGTIITSDGTPLSGANVLVSGRFGLVDDPEFERQVETVNTAEIANAYIHSTYSDSNGRFSFPDLAAVPDAVLTINSVPQSTKEPHQNLLLHPIGPLPSGHSKLLDIVIPSEDDVMTITATIRGVPSGSVLDEVAITIRHLDTGKTFTMYPGNRAIAENLERKLVLPGKYRLWPRYGYMDKGREEGAYAQSFNWSAGKTRHFDFRLPDPFTQSVHVVDRDGEPIPGAKVRLVNDGTRFRSGSTSADGRYSWNTFAPGYPSYFYIAADGYTENETLAVTGEPGAEYPTQSVTLLPAGGVEGNLQLQNGYAAANTDAAVRFTAEAETWLRRQETVDSVATIVTTDESGAFTRLTGIPAVPGSVNVAIRTEAGELLESEFVRVEPVAGAVLDLGTLVLTAPSGASVQ